MGRGRGKGKSFPHGEEEGKEVIKEKWFCPSNCHGKKGKGGCAHLLLRKARDPPYKKERRGVNGGGSLTAYFWERGGTGEERNGQHFVSEGRGGEGCTS